ncbi:hypothetical protein OPV22_020814 [Ensete ventricosum]|uniref:Uncharacterized protein n=1 Tax=Ensete ventricosum TaxID=4639 RepID=A0AAV8QFR2_ENSVE|nr:hypothetical protein OPV22_020814 [Ensete ventricosum]
MDRGYRQSDLLALKLKGGKLTDGISTMTGISLRQSLLLEEGCSSCSEIKSIQSRDNIVFCLSRNQIKIAASTRKVFVAFVRAHTRNQKAAKPTSFPLPQDMRWMDVYTECPFQLTSDEASRPSDIWGCVLELQLPRSSIAELSPEAGPLQHWVGRFTMM